MVDCLVGRCSWLVCWLVKYICWLDWLVGWYDLLRFLGLFGAIGSSVASMIGWAYWLISLACLIGLVGFIVCLIRWLVDCLDYFVCMVSLA